MKVITFISLGLLFFFLSFKTGTKTDIYYDYMHFKREGGGQIDFNLYQTDNLDKLKAVVHRINFHDTTVRTIIIDRNSENDQAFFAFNKAINGQYELNGDFDNKLLLTGTWAYIYFVANGKEIEVSNKELRDKLLYFEQAVQIKAGLK